MQGRRPLIGPQGLMSGVPQNVAAEQSTLA